MPARLICCATSFQDATITSVPIFDFAKANEGLAKKAMEEYYTCCGKSVCGGCLYSCRESGNIGTCPFCNSDRHKTEEEQVEELMKRVEVNDAGAMYVLGSYYNHGQLGLQQDRGKALELWKHAAALGSSKAHFELGPQYDKGGDMKKAKFHYEAAAMAGHEVARYNLGCVEYHSGNVERAVKHWMIAASAGHFAAMQNLLNAFNQGSTSRATIDSTLTAYNNSCVEMRSEARDAAIHFFVASIGAR
jgi:TPR repeat protein